MDCSMEGVKHWQFKGLKKKKKKNRAHHNAVEKIPIFPLHVLQFL